MAKNRNREEVINTQLAILISTMGVKADAETIHMHGSQRPDVLFQLRGLRVVIEGKVGDNTNADKLVTEDARKRVISGFAHLAVAVIYPIDLRTTSTNKILNTLEEAQLKYKIISEIGESENWYEGRPTSLMDALRRTQESLAQDDLVEKTAKSLHVQLSGVARLWMGQEGACDRLSKLLGINPPKNETHEKSQDRHETSSKVSALVLANAFIFQEQLALTDGRISPLTKLSKEQDLVSATSEHWRWIWENINYVPIFQLGDRVLEELPTTPSTLIAVRSLLEEAKMICAQQSALRHDLMGRIYHWLLHHAKYLGTYYTSVASATLLLKLALGASWEKDFGDPKELASFKVADLACGTGTLLMAAAQAVSDRYIKGRSESGRSLNSVDLQTLHRALMENVLHGYDVLPSAVHLTASTLAMLAPEVAFVRMNIYVMPLGVDQNTPKLGSLEFLTSHDVKTQMALDYSQIDSIRTGASSTVATSAKVPKLDLCVMNPPFVRSVGGNLLFGSLPDERGLLQKELKKQVKGISANSTAGLGSVFVALGDCHLKIGGRLAFVLPAALLSGEAWGKTRALIANNYHLEMVVSSHDAEHPNFSENTDLSEILFIAKKRQSKEEAGRTTYINLWKNTKTIHEALDLANRIEQNIEQATSIEGLGFTSIKSSSIKFGEMVTMPAVIEEMNWAGGLFSQTELLRAFWNLQNGIIQIPGFAETQSLAMCPLGSLGELGYDRRDIHDAFEFSKDDWSPYQAFWGHKSNEVTCLEQKPNGRLMVRTKPAKGRKHIKDAKEIWSKAGSILFVERLRGNTHRVLGVRFESEV